MAIIGGSSTMRLEELELIQVGIGDGDALIVIDLQNDFMPSGALPVEGGDAIIGPINALAEKFHRLGNPIIATQDWHPPGHLSFASSHGKEPFDRYEAEGIGPVLWPDHCVQGSPGAEFHPGFDAKLVKAVIRKGFRPTVDSYSAFLENDRRTPTGLSGYLRELGVKRVFLCGLALDYCVFFSALDGRSLGFDVVIPVDLTRAIDSPPGRLSEALGSMVERGVKFTSSGRIAGPP